jgi:nitroreductase
MNDRRHFLAQATAAAAILPVTGCAGNDMNDYDAAAAHLRAPLPVNPDFEALVRFASLAPNGHNAQPWRFAELPSGARILPDPTRRTPVVDPDDHHLFVGLGCAAENLLLASAAHGRPGKMAYIGEGKGRIDIDLATGPGHADALYRAIAVRQSTRSNYDRRPVPVDQLKLLQAAAAIEGVTLLLITDGTKRETVLDFVVSGNTAQMDDPRFVQELRDWIRFNPEQALATGDGLFSKSSGSPAIPTWVGKRFFSMVFRKDAENKKYAEQIRSSAGIAVFIGAKAEKDHWVRVGRSFQRFALQATALGIRHAMINQPVEVPAVRNGFARWLSIGEMRPDLVVRFGYAPPMPMSMRRPARAVIVSA